MEKEYKVTKYSDQKSSSSYSFYRTLDITDDNKDISSFDKFIELENNKNMAFFITDEIILLCYESNRKFCRKFLNLYKEFISNNEDYKIYLNVSEIIKDKLDIEDSNIYILDNNKIKIK